MKRLPQSCPIDGFEPESPFDQNLVVHFYDEHPARIGRSRPIDVRSSFPWRDFIELGPAYARTDGTIVITYLDFPYQISYLNPLDFLIEWAK